MIATPSLRSTAAAVTGAGVALVLALTLVSGLAATRAGATPAKHAKAAKSKGPSAAQLKKLSNKVTSAEHATFEAVYSIDFSGKTERITIAQEPPKSLFEIGGLGESVDTGTGDYYCTTEGTPVCLTSSSSDPLSSFQSLVSPASAISALGEARSQLAARIAGYKISYFSRTVAGQPSTCVSTKVEGIASTYCVTQSGVLASESAAGGSFTLVSFNRSVPASAFTLPAGATVSGSI
jgi:hypothetical protein